MTRKHFEAIAEVICSNMKRASYVECWRLTVLADELATVFSNYNPNFDRDRFLKACGVND